MKSLTVVICVLFLTALGPEESSADCHGSTCEECMLSGYQCAWCYQRDFNVSRCADGKRNLIKAGCQEDLIDDPITTETKTRNEPVHDQTAKDIAIQIQPQEMKIVTRPGMEHKINLKFYAANNYPVDIYFLFDSSVSMMPYVNSLGKLSNDIGRAIKGISANYQLGYGVFQDKVILPFTDTSELKLPEPCSYKGGEGKEKKCAPPFEFKHLLNMTSDIGQFQAMVKSTRLSGNFDHPEGSLDAILQVAVCQNQIGWRKRARKLLIYASNDRFHYAGDGKLAGIFVPNDGKCHINSTGSYVKSLEQDYPSVGQLTSVIEKNDIHVLFIVSNEMTELYEKLSARIPQSAVELLTDESDTENKNIKELVERKYREMLSEVTLVHNNVPGVDVKIKSASSKCIYASRGTSQCKGIEIGDEIDYMVELKVSKCPDKEESKFKEVIINPDSLSDDKLVLNIEIKCCECRENEDKWIINSTACKERGDLVCGSCNCQNDYYGALCECDSSEIDTQRELCKSSEQNITLVCNGLGECKCGECKCDTGFSGPYCECNDQACGSYENQVCGGPTRGFCQCGKCVCNEGYEGDSCGCSLSNSTCLDENMNICNNAGKCECGRCYCDQHYTGDFCQNCFICGNECDDVRYRLCAQYAFEKKEEELTQRNCPTIKVVEVLPGNTSCAWKQQDGCHIRFGVQKPDSSANNEILYVQKAKECAEPVDLIPIVAGMVAGLVGLGLLALLMWKVVTSALDRAEYSKFQEDVKTKKWAQQDNPFYKGATTTHQNPMFARDD